MDWSLQQQASGEPDAAMHRYALTAVSKVTVFWSSQYWLMSLAPVSIRCIEAVIKGDWQT